MSVAQHRNGHDEYYKVGGSLGLDYPYVERDADTELYENLKKCHFCYVLNSRQMGKSSLRVRTMKKLREDENKSFACCSIDLTIIGSQVTAEQWYGGIVSELIRGFNLLGKIDFKGYWENEERKTLSPVQRLERFIEDFLLKEISPEKKIVIFLDEIDSLLRIKDFPIADFFALIKSCYNKRADNPEYNRLTFAFFGVATPSDLVKNDTRVFFNIGKAIELKGFQPKEASGLAEGLRDNAERRDVVLKEIIKWTGGQPFLTQKVCKLIRSSNAHILSGKEAKDIKKLVESEVIKDWESKDEPEHLRTIRDRLLRSEEPVIPLLQTYYQILQGKTINADDSNNVHLKLRLSGLVSKEKGRLKVSNSIYERVFDDRWVQEQLERFGVILPPIIPEWATALFTSAAMTAIVVGVRFTGSLQWMELPALDKLMQLRPPEPIDPRILVVGITEEDLAKDGGISISDKTVGEVIEKLQKYQPKVIGLDIFRDIPIREGAAGKLEHEKLLEILKKNNILASCNIPEINNPHNPSYPSPPGISPKNLGFTNFTYDRDNIVRRQILRQDQSKDCPTDLSLSWQLVRKYLSTKMISTPEKLEDRSFNIGNLTINPLEIHTGGYQIIDKDDYLGSQILVNYRNSKQPDLPFDQVNVTDLLQEPIKSKLPQLIQSRVVLIGYVAQSKGDLHLTPYSSSEPYRQMSGVFIHAHMVSQILSAVEDKRPMLVALPGWADVIYILVYSLVGVVLFIYFKHPLARSVIIASIPGVIFGVSFLVVLYSGIWLPLVPSLMAFGFAIPSLEVFKQVLTKVFPLLKGKVHLFSSATNE